MEDDMLTGFMSKEEFDELIVGDRVCVLDNITVQNYNNLRRRMINSGEVHQSNFVSFVIGMNAFRGNEYKIVDFTGDRKGVKLTGDDGLYAYIWDRFMLKGNKSFDTDIVDIRSAKELFI